MSKFLGGRGRERRRQNSTGSLVSVNSLGSTNSITSRGWRTRADSIVESSSDTNSVLASSYIRVPLADSLAPDVPPGSAKPPGAEETLHHPRAQDAEQARNRADEHAQDIEEERDWALVHARDARDVQEKVQKRIQELEDMPKAVEAALSSKNANKEGDRALEYAREANEAQVSAKDALNEAQSRVQKLEDMLKSFETTSEEKQSQIVVAQGRIQVLEHELTLKLWTVDTLTPDAGRMQSHIDTLTIDLCTSVAVSKNLE
ncbi:hypothetical protein BDN70DRAFT_998452 [Pholiota conissans]|uniref:Uncharacterized protein n=1 Tax=Pholiota conissans TaxID=109636 RepID=A0A9P5YN26_9AGAR|nr:hypothetical protein BDN70DRAFT_998452 [Pholiota conissans]